MGCRPRLRCLVAACARRSPPRCRRPSAPRLISFAWRQARVHLRASGAVGERLRRGSGRRGQIRRRAQLRRHLAPASSPPSPHPRPRRSDTSPPSPRPRHPVGDLGRGRGPRCSGPGPRPRAWPRAAPGRQLQVPKWHGCGSEPVRSPLCGSSRSGLLREPLYPGWWRSRLPGRGSLGCCCRVAGAPRCARPGPQQPRLGRPTRTTWRQLRVAEEHLRRRLRDVFLLCRRGTHMCTSIFYSIWCWTERRNNAATAAMRRAA